MMAPTKPAPPVKANRAGKENGPPPRAHTAPAKEGKNEGRLFPSYGQLHLCISAVRRYQGLAEAQPAVSCGHLAVCEHLESR